MRSKSKSLHISAEQSPIVGEPGVEQQTHKEISAPAAYAEMPILARAVAARTFRGAHHQSVDHRPASPESAGAGIGSRTEKGRSAGGHDRKDRCCNTRDSESRDDIAKRPRPGSRRRGGSATTTGHPRLAEQRAKVKT
jgi:hypothetical protein